MDINKINFDELVADDRFVSWVLDMNPELDSFWENFLQENPEKEAVVVKAKSFVEAIHFSKNSISNEKKESLLDRINTEINKEQTQGSLDSKLHVSAVKNNKMWFYAAASIVAILCSIFLFDTNSKQSFDTAFSEIEEVKLPDGSLVMLNANSKLFFENGWNENDSRDVWLEGEAYFTVIKSAEGKPFIVHAEDLDIKVLGTSFNVNAHTNDIAVVLEEGSVALFDDENEIERLIPGDRSSFNRIDQKIEKEKVNTKVYTSWKSGKLFFDETPLSDLKTIIENNYGYKVIIDDPALLTQKLDGQIDTPNLDVLISTLEIIFNLEITKTESEIIIMK